MGALRAHINKFIFLEKFYWELKKMSKLFQFPINFFQNNEFVNMCPKGTH